MLIEASGLGIQLSPVQKDLTFEKLVQEDERTWSTHWLEWTVQLVIVEGRFAGLQEGRCEVIPERGKCRVAIRIFKKRANGFADRLGKGGSGDFDRLATIQPKNTWRASTI